MFDGLLTRLLQGGGPGAHGGGGQLPPHLDPCQAAVRVEGGGHSTVQYSTVQLPPHLDPRQAAVRLEVTHPCIYDDFIILLPFIH